MNKQPNSSFCFICGVENDAGVHVRFYEAQHDGSGYEIVARFIGQQQHQGYPGRMHGGVISGILDETIGRAINIGEGEQPQSWGVTVELNVRFHKPVPLGVELEARGRIERDRHRIFEGTGELYLPDGSVAVTASGKYVRLKLDTIADMDPAGLGWRVYED